MQSNFLWQWTLTDLPDVAFLCSSFNYINLTKEIKEVVGRNANFMLYFRKTWVINLQNVSALYNFLSSCMNAFVLYIFMHNFAFWCGLLEWPLVMAFCYDLLLWPSGWEKPSVMTFLCCFPFSSLYYIFFYLSWHQYF